MLYINCSSNSSNRDNTNCKSPMVHRNIKKLKVQTDINIRNNFEEAVVWPKRVSMDVNIPIICVKPPIAGEENEFLDRINSSIVKYEKSSNVKRKQYSMKTVISNSSLK
jgi:hypothetical protein